MSTEALFEQQGGRFVANEVTRGPWDPEAQHGGAAAAVLMRTFEPLRDLDEDLSLARVTFEFVRPIPIGEVTVEAAVVRPGRRVQLYEATMRDGAGTEVVRARALAVRLANSRGRDTGLGVAPRTPEYGRHNDFMPEIRPMFAPDGVEIRFVGGRFGGGDSTAWFRLRVPVVADEEPSPLQTLAAASDFGNGISSNLSWDEYMFINPDLTIYIEREPVGEWICLQATTRIAPEGVGLAESVLYDTRGRVGRALQSLLVAPV
jgi:acyl-Coa thioesterase superfamily protein/acyl-CoA thioesterase superfamily protein